MLFCRKIIYADYKQEDMNEDTIKKILIDVFSVHLNNSLEIDELLIVPKSFPHHIPIVINGL